MDRRPACVLLLLTAGCTREPTTPPNIVLISIDSLRADHVGAYGYERDTTPNLDRLARDGVLYESVVAESSWTLPTHVTMLTGLTSLSHGVDEFSGGRIPPAHPTMAEVLKEAGYQTMGLYSGPYLHPIFGFGRGFDRYEGVAGSTLLDDAEFDLNDADAARRITSANARAHDTVTSPEITEKAIAFLDDVGERPFFLFLHYFDVHYDYIPPERYWRKFDPDYDGDLDVLNFRRNDAIHAEMAPADLEHILARYDGEILFTDHYIGKLLDVLDERGLTERTLIAVTSDHGEEFFEHGRKGHGQTLFDEVLLVPLIARLPGATDAGRRIEEPIRHADIMPTMLGWAGLERARASGPAAAVSTLRRNGHWLSLRKPDVKYVVHRGPDGTREVLYELAGDPGESAPLTMGSELGSTTRDALARELKAVEAWAETLRDGSNASVDELPESVREQLKSLGYIQ